MCLFVLIQLGLGRRMLCMITLSCECFNTLVTIVRSYLCVSQRVHVDISNSIKCKCSRTGWICKSFTLDASVYVKVAVNLKHLCFFSCPGQLYNWHCRSLGRSQLTIRALGASKSDPTLLIDFWDTFGRLLRDRDRDRDRRVTWTAFAILAMFVKCLS